MPESGINTDVSEVVAAILKQAGLSAYCSYKTVFVDLAFGCASIHFPDDAADLAPHMACVLTARRGVYKTLKIPLEDPKCFDYLMELLFETRE